MSINLNSERLFLSALFGAFGEQGISYAVLRNAETLPDSLNGGDIDIVVARRDWHRIQLLLSETAKKCGGGIVARMSAPHFTQTELMGCVDGSWWGCCIDLFEGVYVCSVLQLTNDSLLERRVENGFGVWTFPKDIGHYLGFVKEIFVAGRRSSRYEEGARRLIDANADDVLISVRCRDFVRRVASDRFVSPRKLIFKWLVGVALRNPIVFLRDYCLFQCSRILRYIHPSGKMIVLLGTDGSGKSTILKEVLPLVKIMTHNASVVHHLKPDLLPPLGRLRGVKTETGHVCTNPHGSKPSGVIGSILRLTYLTCDYVLGYWFKVRIKIAKTPIGYWIFDRYAYDMLIDPKRFRISLPQWIIRLFLRVIPKPDMIFCLGGDPEQIYARKPETSLNEVCRQVDLLRSFAVSHYNVVWIDTTQSLDDSAAVFLKALCRTEK